ncbi:MAG TPA: transposase [Ktedonobacteraceae bacterium]|nr:transposase [Ktedonobacteraceae bacterium]
MEKTETLEYQRDEHRVHLIVYHLIWCPRRRKPILTGNLKDRLTELVRMKCQEKGGSSWAFSSARPHSPVCKSMALR